MELRQLTYFCAVADLQHLTRASQQLFVAQSAVSRQIQLLELELQVPLFLRKGRQVQLTAFGQKFLPYAKRVLQDVEAAAEEARQFRNPEAGLIRLGFPHSIGIQYVPKLLRDYRTEAPNIHFELIQDRVDRLMGMLRTGALDMAIITPWQELNIEHVMPGAYLFSEILLLTLPLNHRLAAEPGVYLINAQDEPFILLKEGFTLRKTVWDACLKVGFVPKVALEAEDTDTIRSFVEAGLGISLLPPVSHEIPGIVQVQLRDIRVERGIGLTWWHDAAISEAAKRFVKFAVAKGNALHKET